MDGGAYGTFEADDHSATRQARKVLKRRVGYAVAVFLIFVGFVVLVFGASKVYTSVFSFYPVRTAFLRASGDLPAEMQEMMDLSYDPCDNFYQYSCGGFLKNEKLREDQLEFANAWDGVSRNNTHRLRPVLQASSSLAGSFYRSCMNTTAIEALGITPLAPFVKQVQDVKDLVSLTAVMYWFHKANVVVFYDWSVEIDPNDPQRSALYLMQGGITLPSINYYTSQKSNMKIKREGFKRVARKVLRKVCSLMVGCDMNAWPAWAAEKSLEVEVNLAKRFATPEQQRTEHAVPQDIEQITKLAPHLHLKRFINAMAGTYHSQADTIVDKITILIRNTKYFSAISSYLNEARLEDLKAYLFFRLGFVLGADLNAEMEDIGFELQRIVTGQVKKVPRWKKCVHAVLNALPDDAGKIFVEHFFSTKVKQTAEHMLLRIKMAFKQDVESATWMVNQTKKAALVKLHAMFFAVGAPSHWDDYAGVRLDDSKYLWNGLQLSEWYIHHSFQRLTTTVNPRRWGSTSPTMADAFYSYTANGLFVPAGVLQEPFFADKYPPERNFGALGGILGHEMTHGFDDQGRKFGPDGKISDWWTPEDTRKFRQKAECIADFYSKFELLGHHVNGHLTLGEDIADMGGVKLAHRALQSLIEEEKGQKLTNTQQRLFFTSWGQNWCAVERRRAQELQLLTDEHAPNEFRVNGPLASFPEFARTFSCPKGSKMNPVHRCALW